MSRYKLIEAGNWRFVKEGDNEVLNEFNDINQALDYCASFFSGVPGTLYIIDANGNQVGECNYNLSVGPEFN